MGILRTLLAVFVMAFHLMEIPVIGPYAVFSFFVLSGFLMTLIMHHTYGYNWYGVIGYGTNRFFRLYPVYWVVLFISLLILLWVPTEFARDYTKALFVPERLDQLAVNILMIYPDIFPSSIGPRMSPPTWALTVEIFYYILIALGISRSKLSTITWFLVGVLFYIGTASFKLDDNWRYGSIFAASLPFSVGAIIYHFKEELIKVLHGQFAHPVKATAIFFIINMTLPILTFLTTPTIQSLTYTISKYLNIVFTASLVLAVFHSSMSEKTKKLDRIIGAYSYPIYLLHWQIGLFVSYCLFRSPQTTMSAQSATVFGVSILLIAIVSFILIKYVDSTIEIIRAKVKNKIAFNRGSRNSDS